MPYTYLGGQELTYPNYMDAATDRMLIAVPRDDPYDMFPVESGLPVPPADGRWADTSPPPPEPVPEPVPAPAPAPEPAPEGGVS